MMQYKVRQKLKRINDTFTEQLTTVSQYNQSHWAGILDCIIFCISDKKKVRWTASENETFRQKMENYIKTKTMPPGRVIKELQEKMQTRTVPQIRTKIHNIITGKQNFEYEMI